MMTLFEVSNQYIAQAHVRTYVWAEDETQCRELAQTAYEISRDADGYDDNYADPGTFRVRVLFSSDAAPFATEPNGDGFYRPEYIRNDENE